MNGDYDEGERSDLRRLFNEVVGSIIVLFDPLSVIDLSELLDIQQEDIHDLLSDLHSVLNVPKDRERVVRLLHPSFRDFLLDDQRCWDRQFWVNKKEAHKLLAQSCLQLMSKRLKMDFCGLSTPDTLAEEVPTAKVKECLPGSLQYACLYWVQHLQKSKACLQDSNQVHEFLQRHLLHWLEALSLMRKSSEGIRMIKALQSLPTVS